MFFLIAYTSLKVPDDANLLSYDTIKNGCVGHGCSQMMSRSSWPMVSYKHDWLCQDATFFLYNRITSFMWVMFYNRPNSCKVKINSSITYIHGWRNTIYTAFLIKIKRECKSGQITMHFKYSWQQYTITFKGLKIERFLKVLLHIP